MIDYSALAIAKPEPHKRVKARTSRRQTKADKAVYKAVDARDGMRSRLSGEYCGYEIHRHHIIFRSQGGATTVENVISLTPDEHLNQVHGTGTIRLAGNAEWTMRGRLCGVQVYRRVDGVWVPGELI